MTLVIKQTCLMIGVLVRLGGYSYPSLLSLHSGPTECSISPCGGFDNSAPSDSSSGASSKPSSPGWRCFRLLFLVALAFLLDLMRAIIADRLFSPFSSSSSLSARCCLASLRFWSRDRVSWHLMTMPVGMCFSWTAELVLFCDFDQTD